MFDECSGSKWFSKEMKIIMKFKQENKTGKSFLPVKIDPV